MREGDYLEKHEDEKKGKDLEKEMRAYILAIHVIDGGTWLHDLVGLGVSYHSDTPFERLDDKYTTECRLGMIFVNCYIVKLYIFKYM